MKSFNSVYNDKKAVALNESKKAIDGDKATLVAKIKKEYGISDFNTLKEAEKTKFRNMINEMWNKETGLTEAGVTFVNEGVAPLKADSSEEEIFNAIKRRVNKDILNIIKDTLVGKKNDTLTNAKEAIDKELGKKYPAKSFKTVVAKLAAEYIARSIKL